MIYRLKDKNLEFDKTLWLHNREERIDVVKSIIKSKLLHNLSKEEVVDLLGFEFNDIHSNKWSYYLGKTRGCFSFKYYLYIYFNNEGKVFKAQKK